MRDTGKPSPCPCVGELITREIQCGKYEEDEDD
jgi:hypothetical protein